MNKRNITLAIITLFIAILGGFGFYEKNKDKPTEEIIDSAINEVNSYISTYGMNEQQIEELPTTEITEQTEEQEKEVGEEQGTIETEGFEEQGEIAYNGTVEYSEVAIGSYKGLTYYSQIDSRWKNHSYTSIGDYNQTIGTSGCRTYMCKYDSNSNKRNNNTTRDGRFICRTWI